MLTNYLTNNMKKAINESIIVMGLKPHKRSGSPAVIVAFFIPTVQVGFIIHYVGRARNTIALVVNNSGLTFLRFFSVPTLLIIVQSTEKDKEKMKNLTNKTTPSIQLINITTTNFGNEKVNSVNARDLHKFLEVKSNFRDWIKNRINQYDFQENFDYVSFAKNLAKDGRPTIEYHITLDMAKELCMVENNNKGKEARKYFIKCEKELKELSPYSLVNKHRGGANNLNIESNIVFTSKCNLKFLLSKLRELNIHNLTCLPSYRTYQNGKRITISKQTIADFLNEQIDNLDNAFAIMYQPYYKQVVNYEHQIKYKKLQTFLTNQGGCKCINCQY